MNLPLLRLSAPLVLFFGACNSPNTQEGSHPETSRSADRSQKLPTKASVVSSASCERQDFVESVALAEASGATFLSDDSILMIGDSGTEGAFVVVDATSGRIIRDGKLELDPEASDDLEGVSHMNGKLYAITSSGWMRSWSQAEDGFAIHDPSYPLAPVDERELVCSSARRTNCAKNYEGLCLLPTSPAEGQCAGFAASKAAGELICLISDAEGKLSLDSSRAIKVANARSLSGCDFDDQGRLWYGNNFFAGSSIGFVENWQSPAQARITKVGTAGMGFPEAIAVGQKGLVIRASDTSGSPSLLSKYICR